MFDRAKLKRLSHICAYCGKALREEEKTYDHILPVYANGNNATYNTVVCCPECNTKKAHLDINTYLALNERILECFYNYLNLIDIQRGVNDYSASVKKHIDKSLYICKDTCAKQQRLNAVQNIEYEVPDLNISFKLNKTQSKILDYYLANPNFTNHKALARELKIGYGEMISHMTKINCLTGIFVMKNVSKNGIRLNKVYNKCFDINAKNIM